MAESARPIRTSYPSHFIREWRKYRKLTQVQLAEKVGKTHNAISQLERAVTAYTPAILESVAYALRCEPGDLLRINPLVSGEVIDDAGATTSQRAENLIKQRPRFYFREWRKHRGLSQVQLATKIGSSASSICQLESGKQGFTDTTLVAIADALRCEPADLLTVDPLIDGEVANLMGLLRDAPKEVRQQAYEVLATLLRTSDQLGVRQQGKSG